MSLAATEEGDPPNSSSTTWPYLLLFLAAVTVVSLVGGFATSSSVNSWYDTLTKPPWNPPSWVFGPVWILLYALMTIAAYLVARQTKTLRHRAIALFFVQLALNLGWSVIFFGLKAPPVALVELALLIIAVLLCMRSFHRLRPLAGYLLIPYLLWASFAFSLNAAIVYLN